MSGEGKAEMPALSPGQAVNETSNGYGREDSGDFQTSEKAMRI